MQIRFRAILIGALVTLPLTAHAQMFPGADWQRKTPAEAGINPQLLKDAIDFAIASEIKNPRNLKLNHYRTFGREPFGDAIGPIKDRGELTGVIVHKGVLVAEWARVRRRHDPQRR
jgi:predicted RNase H-like HicB family nuclease